MFYISDLWSWDSHVQFSADGHTGYLLVMPTENLYWPGRQAAGETTLNDKKEKEKRDSLREGFILSTAAS